jgi:hypothetical protein
MEKHEAMHASEPETWYLMSLRRSRTKLCMRTLVSPGTGTASRSLVSTGCDTSKLHTTQATIYTL